MDMVKIGSFLSDLRHEYNLTQEQLGEELGVTNKTISRWENGNYLPPIEMLQLLSEKYNVSINEILSGERLTAHDYKEKAEENLKSTLSNSSFTIQEKTIFFTRKWNKEHIFEVVLEILVIVGMFIAGFILDEILLMAIASLVMIIWSFYIRNRRSAYVEKMVYPNPADIEVDKKDENSFSS